MASLKSILLSKYFWSLSIGLHLLLLFLLFNQFGFNFSNEADKYITAASILNFKNFREVLQYQWFSSTYILFLALCLNVGLSLKGILAIQFVISFTGYLFFYKFLLSQSFFSKIYSRICVLIVLCSPIILYWQLSLFSESFFIAISMMATYFAFNSNVKTNLLFTIFFSLLLVFCRPIGVFYILALLFVVLKLKQVKPALIIVGVSYAVVLVLVFSVAPLHFKGVALPIGQGSVICGYPLYPNSIIEEKDYTLAGIYSVFIEQHGVWELCTLFVKKAVSFFTLTRPYYSSTHNLINATHYIFIFTAFYSVYDFKRKRINTLIANYTSILIFSSAVLVILFYNEWSERYIVPLFPFFILLFVFFISKIRKPLVV